MNNPARQRFIPAETIEKVIEKCPDPEWKLIFALARFGGLRVPSETNALRWSDIDFASGRMRVRSPKTEHHEGRESREVPIFPALLPYLRAVHEQRGQPEIGDVISHRTAGILGESA
jgi:integrase